eukprot:Rmarinus@m.28385
MKASPPPLNFNEVYSKTRANKCGMGNNSTQTFIQNANRFGLLEQPIPPDSETIRAMSKSGSPGNDGSSKKIPLGQIGGRNVSAIAYAPSQPPLPDTPKDEGRPSRRSSAVSVPSPVRLDDLTSAAALSSRMPHNHGKFESDELAGITNESLGEDSASHQAGGETSNANAGVGVAEPPKLGSDDALNGDVDMGERSRHGGESGAHGGVGVHLASKHDDVAQGPMDGSARAYGDRFQGEFELAMDTDSTPGFPFRSVTTQEVPHVSVIPRDARRIIFPEVELEEDPEIFMRAGLPVHHGEGVPDVLLYECWVNVMLERALEYPRNEIVYEALFGGPPLRFCVKFELSDQNITKFWSTPETNALNSIGLHRDSLYALGLTRDHVERLYRSLYIYTIGVVKVFSQALDRSTMSEENTIAFFYAYMVILHEVVKANFGSEVATIIAEYGQYWSVQRVRAAQSEIANLNKEKEDVEEAMLGVEAALKDSVLREREREKELADAHTRMEEAASGFALREGELLKFLEEARSSSKVALESRNEMEGKLSGVENELRDETARANRFEKLTNDLTRERRSTYETLVETVAGLRRIYESFCISLKDFNSDFSFSNISPRFAEILKKSPHEFLMSVVGDFRVALEEAILLFTEELRARDSYHQTELARWIAELASHKKHIQDLREKRLEEGSVFLREHDGDQRTISNLKIDIQRFERTILSLRSQLVEKRAEIAAATEKCNGRRCVFEMDMNVVNKRHAEEIAALNAEHEAEKTKMTKEFESRIAEEIAEREKQWGAFHTAKEKWEEEKALLVKDIKQSRRVLGETERRMEEAERKMKKVEGEMKALNKTHEDSLRKRDKEFSQEAVKHEATRENLAKTQMMLDDSEGIVTHLKITVSKLEENVKKLKEELQAAHVLNREIEGKVASLQRTVADNEDNIELLTEKVESLQHDVKVWDIIYHIQRRVYFSKFERMTKKSQWLSSELIAQNAQVTKFEDIVQTMTLTIANVEKRENETRKELHLCEKSLRNCKSQNKDLEATIEDLKSQLATSRDIYENLKSEADRMTAILEKQNKLRNMIRGGNAKQSSSRGSSRPQSAMTRGSNPGTPVLRTGNADTGLAGSRMTSGSTAPINVGVDEEGTGLPPGDGEFVLDESALDGFDDDELAVIQFEETISKLKSDYESQLKEKTDTISILSHRNLELLMKDDRNSLAISTLTGRVNDLLAVVQGGGYAVDITAAGTVKKSQIPDDAKNAEFLMQLGSFSALSVRSQPTRPVVRIGDAEEELTSKVLATLACKENIWNAPILNENQQRVIDEINERGDECVLLIDRASQAEDTAQKEILELKSQLFSLKGKYDLLDSATRQLRCELEEKVSELEKIGDTRAAMKSRAVDCRIDVVRGDFGPLPTKLLRLLAHPCPPMNDTFLTLRVANQLISQIYFDIARRFSSQRKHMCDFVYDFFQLKYGTTGLHERRLLEFIAGLRQYTGSHRRVRMFLEFFGIFAPRHEDALTMYLYILAATFTHAGVEIGNATVAPTDSMVSTDGLESNFDVALAGPRENQHRTQSSRVYGGRLKPPTTEEILRKSKTPKGCCIRTAEEKLKREYSRPLSAKETPTSAHPIGSRLSSGGVSFVTMPDGTFLVPAAAMAEALRSAFSSQVDEEVREFCSWVEEEALDDNGRVDFDEIMEKTIALWETVQVEISEKLEAMFVSGDDVARMPEPPEGMKKKIKKVDEDAPKRSEFTRMLHKIEHALQRKAKELTTSPPGDPLEIVVLQKTFATFNQLLGKIMESFPLPSLPTTHWDMYRNLLSSVERVLVLQTNTMARAKHKETTTQARWHVCSKCGKKERGGVAGGAVSARSYREAQETLRGTDRLPNASTVSVSTSTGAPASEQLPKPPIAGWILEEPSAPAEAPSNTAGRNEASAGDGEAELGAQEDDKRDHSYPEDESTGSRPTRLTTAPLPREGQGVRNVGRRARTTVPSAVPRLNIPRVPDSREDVFEEATANSPTRKYVAALDARELRAGPHVTLTQFFAMAGRKAPRVFTETIRRRAEEEAKSVRMTCAVGDPLRSPRAAYATEDYDDSLQKPRSPRTVRLSEAENGKSVVHVPSRAMPNLQGKHDAVGLMMARWKRQNIQLRRAASEIVKPTMGRHEDPSGAHRAKTDVALLEGCRELFGGQGGDGALGVKGEVGSVGGMELPSADPGRVSVDPNSARVDTFLSGEVSSCGHGIESLSSFSFKHPAASHGVRSKRNPFTSRGSDSGRLRPSTSTGEGATPVLHLSIPRNKAADSGYHGLRPQSARAPLVGESYVEGDYKSVPRPATARSVGARERAQEWARETGTGRVGSIRMHGKKAFVSDASPSPLMQWEQGSDEGILDSTELPNMS